MMQDRSVHVRRGSRSGIALITALIVLVLIGALAAGAFFLALMNLRMAENQRVHAVAKANANSGLDLVLREAISAFDTSIGYPDAVTIPTYSASSVSFVVEEYALVNAGLGARVSVRGVGPGGASYTTNALLGRIVSAASSTGRGLVSVDWVDVNGAGSLEIIDGGVFANNGFEMSGASLGIFKICVEGARDENGDCTETMVYQDVTGAPVASWKGSSGTRCDPAAFCTGVDGSPTNTFDNEIVLEVTYDSALATLLSELGGTVASIDNGTFLSTPDFCDIVDPVSMVNATGNEVVCFSSSRTLTPSEAAFLDAKATVVVNGTLTLSGASNTAYSDLVLIANEQVVASGGSDFEDLRLFSNLAPDFNVSGNGQGNNWSDGVGEFLGSTTIASRQTIAFAGASAVLQTSQDYVGLAIITDGDIDVRGAGNVKIQGNWYAGGEVLISGAGSFELYGSITAGEPLRINGFGNGLVDAGLRSENPDLIGDRGPGVLSIRR